jgi:hypothetical protein
MTKLKVGNRVRVLRNKCILRDEFGEGEEGVVLEASADLVRVCLDRDFGEELEEWSNEFVYSKEDVDEWHELEHWPEGDAADLTIQLVELNFLVVIVPDFTNTRTNARVLLAKDAMEHGNRVLAKFFAVGALVKLGMAKDDAIKFSADRAIERAERMMSPKCVVCGKIVYAPVEDLGHIDVDNVRCLAHGLNSGSR